MRSRRSIACVLLFALVALLVFAASAVAAPRRAPLRTSLSVVAGDMRNTLSWTRPRGVRSFVVYRSSSPAGPFERVSPRPVTATRFVDRVSIAQPWYYCIEGVGTGSVAGTSAVIGNERVAMAEPVGPSGRSLTAANGAVVLAFPAGALDGTRTITVTGPRTDVLAPAGIRTAPVFDLGPSGTVLAVPASLTLRYAVPVSHFQVALALERATDLATFDEQRSAWTTSAASVDTTAGTFTGSLPHFSYWTGAVIQPHGTTPAKTSYCSGVCHNLVDAPGSASVIPSRSSTVCFNCHGNASAAMPPAGATGPNIQAEFFAAPGQSFTATSSRHPVTSGLYCTACHDPHVEPGASYKNLRVYDAVTGKAIRSNATTSNVGNAYCWACHGTTKNRRIDAVIPGYWSRTGDKKSQLAGTGHDRVAAPTPSGIRCLACHTDHGASNRALIATSSAGQPVSGNGKSLCLACHAGGLGAYRGSADYATNKHSGVTTSTKALGKYPASKSDVGGCQNCHDPHGRAGLPSYLRADGATLCPSCHDAPGLTYPSGYGYRGPAVFQASGHGGVTTAEGDRVSVVAAGSADFAAWESTAEPTPSAPGTPISAGRVAGLSSIGGTITITKMAQTTGGIDYQLYRFKPNVETSDVKRMTTKWRGFGEELAGYPVSLYLWNTTFASGAGGWQAFESRGIAAPSTVSTSTTDASPYVDAAGFVHVMAKAVNVRDTDIAAAPAASGATPWNVWVSWSTLGLTDGWVDYGPTTAYGTTVGTSARTQGHSFQVPLTGPNTYHWRVRSTSNDGDVYTSEDHILAVPASTLTPVLDSAVGTRVVSFAWSVPAPVRAPFTYRLRLWNSTGWSTDLSGLTTNTATMELPVATYTWQVEAWDKDGISYGWSLPDYFTVGDVYVPGSCPFLFVWDGERYAFEADLNTTGKLGTQSSSGFTKPDPRDRYVLTAEPARKDGQYEMRLVEERRETDYTDVFRLYAVDLPDGVDLVAEKGDRGRMLGAPPAGLHTVSELRPPLSVQRLDTGEDVTQRVAALDEQYVQLNEDADVGFDYKTLEIDLGAVTSAPQVKIVMSAETERPTTAEGIARQRSFGAATKLEVQNEDGTWRSVPASEASLPNAMEFPRTYVFDITKAMHDTTGRVRFTFLFQTFIDRIAVDTSADQPFDLLEIPLASASLSRHGIDDQDRPGPIFKYVYGRLTNEAGILFPGLYTRYGDVKQLLGATDDKFVIWGQGDEMLLRFDPPAPPAQGRHRRYVTFIEGYYKNSKSAVPLTVEPLPFAAMSNYPYGEAESYPTDAEHEAYRVEYNTRQEPPAATQPQSALMQWFERTVSTLRTGIAAFFRPDAPAKVAEAAAPVHRSLNTDYVGLEFELEAGGPNGQCSICHAVHGATDWDGKKLAALRAAPDGRMCTANGSGGCHSAPATAAAGVNIYAKVTEWTDPTSHHDVLPSQQVASGARVACGDCHNPHSDDATSTWSEIDDKSAKGKKAFSKYLDANGRVFAMVTAKHDGRGPTQTGLVLDIVTAGPQSPILRWTTDEPGTTYVDYGLTTAYELGTVGSGAYTTSHSATLPGLVFGNAYYFRIRSADPMGNESAGAAQFYEPVPAPSAPTVSPITTVTINGAGTGPGNVTITWTPVAATDGGSVQYYVDAAVDSGWISGTTSWTTPNVYWGGVYSVAVKARNALHPLAESPYSASVPFVVQDVNPPAESCPDLFAWDGSGFAFVTDVMNNAPIGLKTRAGYLFPRPYEETRIDPSLLEPKGGRYELRLRDNNNEIEYVDRVALKVVDHPKGTQVFLDDFRIPLTTGLPPEQRIFTVRDPKPIESASYSRVVLYKGEPVTDQDVTAEVARADRVFAPASLYDDNRYTFDLGDLSGAQEIKMLMTGWTEVPTSEERAARKAAGTPAADIVLEVQGPGGRWLPIESPAGYIPGYAKTVVYDLTGKFPDRLTSYKVRLRGLSRTHIDQVLVDTSKTEKVTVREVAPSGASLSYAGVASGERYPQPTFDYYKPTKGSIGLHQGMFTKFGDVLPLTGTTDDKFVIMDTGDELALSFPVPAVDSSMDRTCVIVTDGYYQQNTGKVDPKPFHAMSGYPYGPDERYPADDDHREYLREWNTRVHTGEVVPASQGGDARALQAARLARRPAILTQDRFKSTFDTVAQQLASWPLRVLAAARRPLSAPLGMRTLAEEPAPLHYSANTDAVVLRMTSVDGTVTTYAASAGWESVGTTMAVPSPSLPGAAVAPDMLARTASVDSTYWVTDLTSTDGEYNRQVFAFDIGKPAEHLGRELYVSWTGHAEPTPGYENAPVYLWNFETSGWDKVVEGVAATDVTLGSTVEGIPSSYCLACHDGSPPAGVVFPANVVNIGAKWGTTPGSADRHGDLAGTGRYSVYGGSAYSSLGSLAPGFARGSSAIGCVTCHDPHGNGNRYHLQSTVNGRQGLSIRETGSAAFCKSCHVGTVREMHEPCAVQCHYGEVDHYDDITYLLPNESSDCLECHRHGVGWGHQPGCAASGHEGCGGDWYWYDRAF